MTPVPAAAPAQARSVRPAYWFPLALFGLIVAASVPLHEAELTTGEPVGWFAYAPLTRTVSASAYSSSLSVTVYRGGGPFSVPEGWYWAGALTLAFLLTTMWYRRAGRRPGQARPGWPYLITGLVLTAVITAVPPLVMQRAWPPDMLWLDRQWAMGTFALLVIAVALGMLAWQARSRVLTMITLAFTAAALAAAWPALRAARILMLAHFGDPRQALGMITAPAQPYPAALLLAGLVLLAAAALAFGWPARFAGTGRDRTPTDPE